ncbi:lysosomal acid phosphatase-like isoform X2 [Diabrotica virgifera virgifera]|uniref:acid phosphatase n=1 Tax=Diabrotica virgifera virgifera TaxID=50390 RepID=A0ABM5JUJ2_DIAVI|nr:lysosomal acid phosphatase-like isoform X2 [Diabrotica virgifera virgifera]
MNFLCVLSPTLFLVFFDGRLTSAYNVSNPQVGKLIAVAADGIKKLYNLGQSFRQRYQNFLSDIYSPNEIYVHSSQVDRCLMSAAANLAGLYPPKSFQLWNQNILWQPIPIHTTNIKDDHIITEKRHCRKSRIIMEHLKNQTYPPLYRKYSKVIEYLSLKTGWNPISLSNIKTLNSVINTYKSYNKSFVPEWLSKLETGVLEYFSDIVYGIQSSTPEIARLRIGPFFNYIIQNFDSFLDSQAAPTPKFLAISAHGTMISSTLGAMQANRTKIIKFGDSVLWELRQRNNGSYYVNVVYKNETDFVVLKLLRCDYDCNYNNFKKILANIVVNITQWEYECNN